MKRLGVYLLLLLLSLSLVSASFISLTTEITVTDITPEHANITLNITNRGDESALSIQPILEFNNKQFQGEIKNSLAPGSSHSLIIPIKTLIVRPGRYPFIIRTNYLDMNSYAFSSISPSYITIQEDTVPSVFGRLDNIEMTSSERLGMEIINLDDQPKDITLKLYLPRELATDNETLKLVMAPKSKQQHEFNIERFSALPGSNYAISAIIEYEENNKHYTNILTGSIKLVEESTPIKSKTTITVAAIILILFLISITILELKRKKRIKTTNREKQNENLHKYT